MVILMVDLMEYHENSTIDILSFLLILYLLLKSC